jgi:hypothetical protein
MQQRNWRCEEYHLGFIKTGSGGERRSNAKEKKRAV